MSKTIESRNSSWGPTSKCSFQRPLSATGRYLIDHVFSWLNIPYLLSPFLHLPGFYLSLETTLPIIHSLEILPSVDLISGPPVVWGRLHFCSSSRWCWKFVDSWSLLVLLLTFWTSHMNMQAMTSHWSLWCLGLEADGCEYIYDSLKNTLSAIRIHYEEVSFRIL